MSAAKPLTADSIIGDNEIWRWDYDGSPRFYLVRIYPADPIVYREGCTTRLMLRRERVKVHVQLEGDPSAWHQIVTDDGPSTISDAVMDCVGQIEDLMSAQWDREQESEKRDCLTAYERQFGY